MFIKMKLLTILIIFTTITFNAVAQEGVLENYIQLGLDNNLNMKRENLELASSLEALNQARSLFMPNVSFNASYTFAGGGRNIAIPIGDLLNPVYTSLNQLTDTKQFPTDLKNAEEQLMPDHFHDTRIEVRQPLFSPDILYNYKAKQSLVSAQEAQRDTYKHELIKEIKTSYYQYLTTVEAIKIYESTEELLREIVRVNRKLVENNKATIDAIYRSEYELSDLDAQIAAARQLNNSSKSYFNFLLNRELGDTILVDTTVLTQWYQKESIEILQEEALQKREELEQIQHSIMASEHLVSLNQSNRLPQVNLGANVGYQGFHYTFDDNQDYYLVQLSMSFPLFKGFHNKSKIEASKIEIQKLQTRQEELKKQIRLQVINAYRQVEAQSATMKAKQASLKSASKSFDIIARKYLENQITLLELLDARTKYTNAQLEVVVARYEMLIREATLERTIALNN
jgi:outer membrane protein TolC